jgi:hypothetical protein
MTIYDYIKAQENYYNTTRVPVVDGYDWNMSEHVRLTTLYLNSQYKTGKQDDKPFRNIILPKVNLEHRAVEFALKEIEFFINDPEKYYKSFLVRKYHDKWALQNDISQFLDKLSETYTDYGGVLIKNTKESIEVVFFQRLAFVDQTDMMSGPICEKHQYSPDQLKEMEKAGWGNPSNGATGSIDEVIALAQNAKTVSQSNDRTTNTPGRYIEVYELHGVLSESFLHPEGEPNKFIRQMQIITYYVDENGDKKGITLFKGKEREEIYKAFKRDEIYGRALGRGAVEELFEPQVWVNYSEIQKKELLDQASKVLYQTADASFTNRNKTANLESGEVLIHADGKPLSQVNNTQPNVTAFDNAIAQWDTQAKDIAAAYDTIQGAESKSGMPFRLGMLLNQEAHSLHKYRKSQLGFFLTEVYRDWIIPRIGREIVKGDEFLATLSLDEMQELSDRVITNLFNQSIVKKLLAGEKIEYGEPEKLLETYKLNFFKGGNRRFLKILKDEMKDLPLDVQVNITDEQKNKALLTEKLSSIFTQVTQILSNYPNFFNDHPEMAKLFNEILESSGLSPLTYGNIIKRVPSVPQTGGQNVQGQGKVNLPSPQPNQTIPAQV